MPTMQPSPRHLRSFFGRTAHLLAVTAPSFAGRGGQFLALTSLAALVAPAEYGRFVVLQALVVGIASVLGSTTAVAVNGATARVPAARTLPVIGLYAAMLRGRRRAFAAGAFVSAAFTPIGYAVLTGSRPSVAEIIAVAALGALSGAMPLGDALVAVVSGSGRYALGSTIDAARALVGAGAALTGAVVFGPIGGAMGLVVADVLLLVGLLAAMIARRPERITLDSASPAREGMAAGIVANITGQVTQWVLLFGIQLVGGAAGLGIYGVANRFASVVTLAPIYFGKTVIGQLADDTAVERRWTPRSFTVMLGTISTLAAAVAFGVMTFGFPTLADSYDGLAPVTLLLLGATILRALLIGFGHVCVARRRWTTWVVADLASLVATILGTTVVWTTHGNVLGMIAVFGLGNLAGLTVRVIGSRDARSVVSAPRAV
jgi:hypothetical protein